MTLPNGNTIRLTNGETTTCASRASGAIWPFAAAVRGNRRCAKKDPVQKAWLDEEVRKLYRGKPIRGQMAHMAGFLDCALGPLAADPGRLHPRQPLNACHMANIAMIRGRQGPTGTRSGSIHRRRERQRH